MRDGFDPIEANTRPVSAEPNPVVKGDSFFSGVVDPDTISERWHLPLLAADAEEHLARAAGKAGICPSSDVFLHGHLNVSFRNIAAGKPLCGCSESAVAEKLQCSCDVAPILDENSNYSLSKLRGFDPDR